VPEPPPDLAAERRRWREFPRERPREIEPAGPGQESVWDYPRPPRVEPVRERLRVEHAGVSLADTTRGLRVLETASPPVYYLPRDDVRSELFVPSEHVTFCEWKGLARHWSLRMPGRERADVAWSYPEPDREYELIRDAFAFYAGRVDACWVGEERVRPQAGSYYGGWITSKIRGPWKGSPGSAAW